VSDTRIPPGSPHDKCKNLGRCDGKAVLQAEFPDCSHAGRFRRYTGLTHGGGACRLSCICESTRPRQVLRRSRDGIRPGFRHSVHNALLDVFISASTIFTTLAGSGTKPVLQHFLPVVQGPVKKSTTLLLGSIRAFFIRQHVGGVVMARRSCVPDPAVSAMPGPKVGARGCIRHGILIGTISCQPCSQRNEIHLFFIASAIST